MLVNDICFGFDNNCNLCSIDTLRVILDMTFLFSKPKTKDSPYSLFVLISINDFFSPGNRIKRIEFAYLLHICFVHLQPPLIFIFVVSIYWFAYASHFIDVKYYFQEFMKRIHEFEANDLI